MHRLIVAGSVLLILGCNAKDKYQFTYSEAEAKGWSSAGLDSLAAYLEKLGSSGMILMVDGDVIFEWGEIKRRHTIHSIRKAMLNSLYGIKIAEGVIDTTETIGNLGIDDIYPLTEQ